MITHNQYFHSFPILLRKMVYKALDSSNKIGAILLVSYYTLCLKPHLINRFRANLTVYGVSTVYHCICSHFLQTFTSILYLIILKQGIQGLYVPLVPLKNLPLTAAHNPKQMRCHLRANWLMRTCCQQNKIPKIITITISTGIPIIRK